MVLLPSLSGCAKLAGLAADYAISQGAAEPLVSIDTEVVTGDKNQTAVETNKTTNASGEVVNIVDEGVPFWQATTAGLLLFFIGVFLPQLTIIRKKL